MTTESSNQVQKAIVHGDGPAEELEAIVVGILDGLEEGSGKVDALARLKSLADAFAENDMGRLQHYVEHGEDVEAGDEY